MAEPLNEAQAQAPRGAALSGEALAQRLFTPPLVYAPSRGGYGLEVAAPFLLPAGVYAMTRSPHGGVEAGWELWMAAAVVGALALSVVVAWVRRPGARRVSFDACGLHGHGRHWPWPALAGAALMAGSRRGKVRALVVRLTDGHELRVSAELARTGRLGSLSNVSELLNGVASGLGCTSDSGTSAVKPSWRRGVLCSVEAAKEAPRHVES